MASVVLLGKDLPPSLKPIATYLQRAREIAPRAPVVAYYARLYALQLALELRPKMEKADMGTLLQLMDAMEEEKRRTDLSQADVPSALVEDFAQDLFARADEVDRAGVADMKVGRAFYAASVVIDVCRQFGELPADLHEKHKYARWRFVEISKATREGRAPAPPPDIGGASLFDDLGPSLAPSLPPAPGGGTEGAAEPPGGPAELPPPPLPPDLYAHAPPPPPPHQAHGAAGYGYYGHPAQPAQRPPPPAAAAAPPPPAHYPPRALPPSAPPPGTVPPDALFAAQRHAKFAVSALQFADVPTAVHNLHAALAALGEPPSL